MFAAFGVFGVLCDGARCVFVKNMIVSPSQSPIATTCDAVSYCSYVPVVSDNTMMIIKYFVYTRLRAAVYVMMMWVVCVKTVWTDGLFNLTCPYIIIGRCMKFVNVECRVRFRRARMRITNVFGVRRAMLHQCLNLM